MTLLHRSGVIACSAIVFLTGAFGLVGCADSTDGQDDASGGTDSSEPSVPDNDTVTESSEAKLSAAEVAKHLCETRSATREVEIVGMEGAETSGVAASRTHDGVFWTHNDSGDSARFFAIPTANAPEGGDNSEAEPVQWSIPDATSIDWEDIALGPGPDSEQLNPGSTDHLHLADIGDNNRERETVQIHRVPEPDQPTGSGNVPPGGGVAQGLNTFHLKYPDQPHDAESFIVDPLTGDWFVVTKDWDAGMSQVFRVPATDVAGSGTDAANAIVMEAVGTADMSGHGRLATAADVSPDGSLVVVRTYTDLLVYPREPSEPLQSAFSAEPCSAPVPIELQAEAVALISNESFATIAERPGNRLHITEPARD